MTRFIYPNRGTYENLDHLVDEIFNQYIVGEGRIEPFYAQFCDGKLSKCQGLYQWGSVDLANQGYSPLEILQYYYEDNISIKTALIEESNYRFENPLKLGDSGLDVLRKELQLDRISLNFPAIPKIDPIDGYYDETTEAAVREFQRVFNLPITGIIDKSTWYKITNTTTAVKKLAETTSEGILLSRFEQILSSVLLEGDVRPRVTLLQYFLVIVSLYITTIPEVAITGVFDNQTRLAVIAYQKTMDLEPTGIVNLETWESTYNQAIGILNTLPEQNVYLPLIRFPRVYALGDQGPGVFVIQEMLQYISNVVPQIPYIEVTQIFDEDTENAVIAFQNFFNLEPTGILDETTWNNITEIYRAQRYGNASNAEINILNDNEQISV